MSKHSTFSIKLIIILAIGVGVLTIGLFTWHRQNMALTVTQRTLAAKNAELDSILRELREKPAVEKEQRDLDAFLASIDTDLVAYEYLPTYLKQIELVATKSGNTIASLSPSEIKKLDLPSSPLAMTETPSKDAEKAEADPRAARRARAAKGKPTEQDERTAYRVQKIRLDVEGTFPSVLALLNELRTFPKLVYVNAVTIQPVRSSNGRTTTGRLTATIETYAIITPEQYQPKAALTAGTALAVEGGEL